MLALACYGAAHSFAQAGLSALKPPLPFPDDAGELPADAVPVQPGAAGARPVMVTAFVGLKFLTSGMHALDARTAAAAPAKREQQEADAGSAAVPAASVSAGPAPSRQLAWTPRPFVGEPHEKFQVFRPIEGNFQVNIIHPIGDLFYDLLLVGNIGA